MESEKCTGLRGSQVVALEEGATLGTVQEVYMDLKNGKLSSITFKENMLGKTRFENFYNVSRIGENVVFIKSKRDVKELNGKERPKGENLKSLQGMWITTYEGEHVGNLTDVDFDHSSWQITDIYLSDGSLIPVKRESVTFGKDEILIQTELLKLMKKTVHENRGILNRLFGGASAEQITGAVQRVLHGFRKKEPPPQEISIAEESEKKRA